MVIAPCRDCQYRKFSCHSSCKRYKLYREELQKTRESERHFKEETDISFEGMNRMKRYRCTNGIVSGGRRGKA